MYEATPRKKLIKAHHRKKKIALIESINLNGEIYRTPFADVCLYFSICAQTLDCHATSWLAMTVRIEIALYNFNFGFTYIVKERKTL